MADIIEGNPARLFQGHVLLSIASGRLKGYQVLDIHGTHEDVDSGTEDVWVIGGVRTNPTTAAVVSLASASPEDNNTTGTGIGRVRIFGLDANWDYQEEIITLVGTSPVSSVGSYIRLNGVQGLDTGTAGVAVGQITARIGGDDQARIDVGRGSSQLTQYSIARNRYGYVGRLFASGSNTADDSRVEFQARCMDIDGSDTPGPWTSFRNVHADNRHIAAELDFGITVLPPKTDIRVQAVSLTNNETFSAGYTLVLEEVDSAEINIIGMHDGRYQALKVGES